MNGDVIFALLSSRFLERWTFFNERGNGKRVMNFPYRPRVGQYGFTTSTACYSVYVQRINRVCFRTLSNPVHERLQTEKKRKSGLTCSYTQTRHATETHYPFTCGGVEDGSVINDWLVPKPEPK